MSGKVLKLVVARAGGDTARVIPDRKIARLEEMKIFKSVAFVWCTL